MNTINNAGDTAKFLTIDALFEMYDNMQGNQDKGMVRSKSLVIKKNFENVIMEGYDGKKRRFVKTENGMKEL